MRLVIHDVTSFLRDVHSTSGRMGFELNQYAVETPVFSYYNRQTAVKSELWNSLSSLVGGMGNVIVKLILQEKVSVFFFSTVQKGYENPTQNWREK